MQSQNVYVGSNNDKSQNYNGALGGEYNKYQGQ